MQALVFFLTRFLLDEINYAFIKQRRHEHQIRAFLAFCDRESISEHKEGRITSIA